MNNKKTGFLLVFSLFFISKAFCGPFGLDFGMSYEQIRNISTTEPINIKSNYYLITPSNINEQFEAYIVCIHPYYGVYSIKAISKYIKSNEQGIALKSRFIEIVSSFEKIYGKYKKNDSAVISGLWVNEPDYYMYALARGARVLIASWSKNEDSKLPTEYLYIYVTTRAVNSSMGYIVIEFYSKDYLNIYEKIELK